MNCARGGKLPKGMRREAEAAPAVCVVMFVMYRALYKFYIKHDAVRMCSFSHLPPYTPLNVYFRSSTFLKVDKN